jgi:RimJ/RimL family protein N-acetyltransferase
MRDLFRGELVRLGSEDPETRAKAEVRWERDTEYHRLADGDPAQLWSEKKMKEWVEKRMQRENLHEFSIRSLPRSRHDAARLADDRLIGAVGLFVDWPRRDAWVGIAIGERDFWGKGYGTDAMRLILLYGFTELNLRRVSLAVHSYNTRARRSYEKAGFVLEGVMRGDQLKEGKRSDSVFMGILHEEWLAINGSNNGSINGFQRMNGSINGSQRMNGSSSGSQRMNGSTDPSGSTDRATDNG